MNAESIRNMLTDAGIACYAPAQKVGKCMAPYCVVVENQTLPQKGSRGLLGQRIFEVICMVPLNNPDALDTLIRGAKTAVSNLRELRCTGEADATGVEESYAALARSLIYSLPCRLQ